MTRPCEDVIVISDHEEGELTDSDFGEVDSPPPKLSKPSKPRAALVSEVKAFRNAFRESVTRWRAPVFKPFARYHPLRPLRDRPKAPKAHKAQKAPRRRTSDSESEAERKPSKRTFKLPASPMPSKSSLRLRLSNMMTHARETERRRLGGETLPEDDSDEDADRLRELALKTKADRLRSPARSSEDDTEIQTLRLAALKSVVDNENEVQELRMAALKSAILKKAFRRKKMGKIQRKVREKRSVSVSEISETVTDYSNFMYNISDPLYPAEKSDTRDAPQTEDPDEDEDSLRTNLLASLKSHPKPESPPMREASGDRRSHSDLIVRLGESDSESDCEATKNLAAMHKKLTEQSDFQRNLDLYLKSVRSSVPIDDRRLPEEPGQLQVPSSVKNLTRSDQQEYQRLKMRIQELERTQSKKPDPRLVVSNGKQVLKPSTSVNKGPRGSATSEIDSPVSERSQKVIEQHLTFVRKKIINQSQAVEKQRFNLNNLMTRKNLLLRQLKTVTVLLRSTEKEFTVGRKSYITTSRHLAQLLKQQSVLLNQQKRFSKLTHRKCLENVPPVSSNGITEKSITSTADRRVVNESGSHTSDVETLELSKNKVSSGTDGPSAEYMEYDSSILGLKGNDGKSWSHDPNDILCPFEVGGFCKDPSCGYTHFKKRLR